MIADAHQKAEEKAKRMYDGPLNFMKTNKKGQKAFLDGEGFLALNMILMVNVELVNLIRSIFI